ncbi:MAG TPA: glycoside hydrolase family 3 C-terminal domain-containing protein [Acidimicrobiales bacterium]|nr:glycoside hydrolase family 3 C-terminal domain-containing protein [Acidimicrobiales bacterium]
MNIDEILRALTIDEKASLTHGRDLWSTHGVERVGIPTIVVTDGPNGARGPVDPERSSVASICVPCGSSLGATWDPLLIEQVGALIGGEARGKGCRVLLAPTVNMHRTPLAGRNFECYSEDPLLSGRLAAAFVRGAQAEGVATTVKHFVANDAEQERYVMSSVVDQRTLREIYLVPFELAVREGAAMGIMTAYNRVNGTWCSEHHELLRDILRDEWGFDGFVISDWFAAGSTEASARAGLDLEMPGPGRFFGPALADAVRADLVDERVLDDKVRNLLRVWQRIGALGAAVNDSAADDHATVGADDAAGPSLAHRAATDSMVLLKNEAALPLAGTAIGHLAVIGPNADRVHIMGGGSASLEPQHRTTPLAALRARMRDSMTITYEPGCVIDRSVAPLAAEMHVEFFGGPERRGEVVHRRDVDSGRITLFGNPPGIENGAFSFRATATVRVADSGPHVLSLVQIGRARVLVDGRVVIDATSGPVPPRGTAFYGAGSQEQRIAVELQSGRSYEVVVEYASAPSQPLQGIIVGLRPEHASDLVERAVEAARAADAVVLVVGTSGEWESEGFDRQSLHLPGVQDDLVRRVSAANPNCTVVVNAGSPIAMPWIDQVAAVLVCGLGGQEMAHALVDVLFGDCDPGGRLPTTYPRKLEDNPTRTNFPGEHGELRYGEGLFVGYRWYEAREIAPLFPFGHGLSYTTFVVGAPTASATTYLPGIPLQISVPVHNTGERRGAEVVQCYVEQCDPRCQRPRKELKAFAKLWLEPHASATATLILGDRSFAYWFPGDGLPADTREKLRMPLVQLGPDDKEPRWRVDPGRYRLHIGRSSTMIDHVLEIDVASVEGE